MKQRQNGWLYLFWVALAIELLAPLAGMPGVRYFSKPLLMVCLAGWYIVQASATGSDRRDRRTVGHLKRQEATDGDEADFPQVRQTHTNTRTAGQAVIAALFFSWLGDVFLLFESRIPLFFMTGLSAFLIAHLLYIFYFNRLRTGNRLPWRFVWLVPIFVYLLVFLRILQPTLGAFTWPVRVYAVAICVMLFFALQLTTIIHHRKAVIKIVAGALLFVASDSLLALDKFYRHFNWAGFLVMLTYATAQYLIVTGAARLHQLRNPAHEALNLKNQS